MITWTKHKIDDFSEVRSTALISASSPEPMDVVAQTIAELGVPIPPRLNALIELGDDPYNPIGSTDPKYPSRSEATYAVMTWLCRLGVSPEKVAGLCINPTYGVSERFLERAESARQALKEALRAQIKVSADWPDVYKNGNPRPTYHNAYVGLIRMGIQCRYDEFKNRLFVGLVALQELVGELSNKSVVLIRKVFLDFHHFDPFTQNLRDGLETLAHENAFHPIKEYFATIKWDGMPRIRSFFSAYMEAEDTALNRAIAFLMFVAAVRRVMRPGCKFDTMIVLEGKQGSGKSTALSILASNEFFSDQDIISVDSKTQMELLEGVWIYEVCELSGLKHTEISKIKSFLSRQEDRGRPAYGRYKEVIKRQSIFVGTTNDDTYLKDQTGNRRFLPVKTGAVDLKGIEQDRDQLWAEALHWEAKDASIVLPEELWEVSARAQADRMYQDPWEDLLADVTGSNVNGEERVFTMALMEKLEISASQQQHYQATRVGICMRKLGWEGPKRIRIDGKSLMGYTRGMPDNDPDY